MIKMVEHTVSAMALVFIGGSFLVLFFAASRSMMLLSSGPGWCALVAFVF
jgi:hypothetical protein